MADTIPVYDRIVIQGDCFDVALEYQDSNGDPIDLSGYDAEVAAADKNSEDADHNWLADVSGTVTGDGAGTVTIDGPAGVIQATVPADITKTWTVGKKSARYQVAIISPDGCRKTLLLGDIQVVYSPIQEAETEGHT